MIKPDKQFIARLFRGLDRKIDDRFGTLDRKIDDRFGTLDRKIDCFHEELMTEIRHEGVLREQSDHNIKILVEGYQGLNERMERMEKSMAVIEENTALIPVLGTVVKDHSRRIAALEKR